MNNKLTALLTASAMLVSLASCSSNEESSAKYIQTNSGTSDNSNSTPPKHSPDETPPDMPTEPTEATTEHISPVETVSASCGTQIDVNSVVKRVEGSNTVQIPLSNFIEDGDVISSFTFIVYSEDGYNIGTFKGGCGISVTDDCKAATDKGWYQSEDFTAATQGTYGEIRWNVPEDVKDYVTASGDLLFGYWWGGSESIRLESVVCTFTRTRELPIDGTASEEVKKSVSFNDEDNTVRIATADFLPENAVPQAVTFNISSSGALGKFTGAFGYSAGSNYYQSADTAVFTDNSSLSLVWFVPQTAKNYVTEEGELVLGYWWSEQPVINVDSVEVKYSLSGEAAVLSTENVIGEENTENSGFRSAGEIVSALKVGWNLGNTLECYEYSEWTDDAETAWGNPRTTAEMIKSVKSAGFNAVRIPVTWGEHLSGDNTVDSEWLDRVQEVVNYAYDEDMFVVLNMHHDDYIWFEPSEEKYAEISAKYKRIWEQIAERFGEYGDRLLFEGMNEPRTIGSANEWMGGTESERNVVNKYAQDFVSTVRSSGGNNAYRTLIVTTYGASAETAALNGLSVPNDKNIIVSVHYYAPWKFAEGENTVFGEAEKKELGNKFAEIKSKSASLGVPFIIGEFGCVNVADENTRAQYYEYYVSEAKAQGLKCFVWDNNVAEGESSYGIFNRENLSWINSILNGIIKGAE